MKFTFILIAFLAFGSARLDSCSATSAPSSSDDCGYLATYDKPAEGKSAEITFSMVLAEVLNGHKNCGFGFRPGRVDKAEINGKPMSEKVNGDKYLYIAPPGFDATKDTIQIVANGTSYISTPGSIQQGTDKRISISLRPAPPK